MMLNSSCVLIAILADSDTQAPPTRYIFHIGHCGSTLIARLLGELEQFLSLREPPVLMGLSRSCRVLDSPEFGLDRDRWQALFELAEVYGEAGRAPRLQLQPGVIEAARFPRTPARRRVRT